MSWRALFEPFDKTQDKLRELVRPPQAGVRPFPCGQTGRHWFWVLLPKQKGLACRGETRQHQISRGHESWGHTCEAFTCQRLVTGKPQDGFPIHIVKL